MVSMWKSYVLSTMVRWSRLSPALTPFSPLPPPPPPQTVRFMASRKRTTTTTLDDRPSPIGKKPRGVNQEKYVHALNDPEKSIVFGTGPAGCGKTMFACYAAAEALQRQEIQKIVLTRPVVSVEEELGFLPGNIQRKMDPWLQPLFDLFLEYYTQNELNRMIAQGQLEISPLGFMRGRTFKQCFVIADEMQNSSPGQMQMLLTRLGEESKMVITGDPAQSDLAYHANGLTDFLGRYQRTPKTTATTHLAWVKLTAEDVVRSEAVCQVLRVYDNTLPESLIPIRKPAGDSDAALIPRTH